MYEKRLAFCKRKFLQTSGEESKRWAIAVDVYEHLLKCTKSHRDKKYCIDNRLTYCKDFETIQE